MKITKHGKERAKERTHLSKKQVEKYALEALALGYSEKSFKGKFKRYLDLLRLNREQKGTKVRLYKGNIFIYVYDSFITTFQLDKKFINTWNRYLVNDGQG